LPAEELHCVSKLTLCVLDRPQTFILPPTCHFLADFNGTRIKTRKRNIAVPLDTGTFADAVVLIYNEHKGDLVSELDS
jgi:hypothetical protein